MPTDELLFSVNIEPCFSLLEDNRILGWLGISRRQELRSSDYPVKSLSTLTSSGHNVARQIPLLQTYSILGLLVHFIPSIFILLFAFSFHYIRRLRVHQTINKFLKKTGQFYLPLVIMRLGQTLSQSYLD